MALGRKELYRPHSTNVLERKPDQLLPSYLFVLPSEQVQEWNSFGTNPIASTTNDCSEAL